MGRRRKLSFTAFSVLYAVVNGHQYGLEIMEAAGLASGTVYPVLSRLERDGLVTSSWEDEDRAAAEGRPARRYYRVSNEGLAALGESLRVLRDIGGGDLKLPDGVRT